MIRVPCAKTSDGKVVFPHTCRRSKDYTCVRCGSQVVLKRGAVKVPHFAHKGAGACAGESLLHLSTKEFIAAAVSCPDFTITAECHADAHHHVPPVFRGSRAFTGACEVSVGAYRVDVGVFKNGKLHAAIEVCHTHACAPEKLRWLSSTLRGGAYEVPAVDLVYAGFPMGMSSTKDVRCVLCVREAIDRRRCSQAVRRRRLAQRFGVAWMAKAKATRARREQRFGKRWLLLHRLKRCARLVRLAFAAEEHERLKPCEKCGEPIPMFEWAKTTEGHNAKSWFDVLHAKNRVPASSACVVKHDGKLFHAECSPVCMECFEPNQHGKWCACKKRRMRPCQGCDRWLDKDADDVHQFTVPKQEREDQNGWVCEACAVECKQCDKKISTKQAKWGGKCYTCNRKRKIEDMGVHDSGCVDCGKLLAKEWYTRCWECNEEHGRQCGVPEHRRSSGKTFVKTGPSTWQFAALK